jgi:hypothetical protein
MAAGSDVVSNVGTTKPLKLRTSPYPFFRRV